MCKALEKIANKKFLIIMLIIWAIYHLIMILFGDFMLLVKPAEQVVLPDLKLFYDVNLVKEYFAALGAENIQSFINFHLIYDSIYPFIYGFLLLIMLAFFGKNRKKYYLVLPAFAIIFDFLENYYLIQMAKNADNINQAFVSISSTMSNLKWISIFANFAFIIYFLIEKKPDSNQINKKEEKE